MQQQRLATAHLARRALLLAAVVGLIATAVPAQDEPKPQAEPAPLGRFLTLTSPVDDSVYVRVTNAALALENRAKQENRRAVLVLEISPGSSQFHHVQGLAKFLTSSRLSRVRTVAWIPETVIGNNAVLALACNEIVMHPAAELGDIGRGRALDLDEQQAVINLVEKRHNPKVNRALAIALMDPQKRIWKVQLQPAGAEGPTETRVVTEDELNQLRDAKTVITDTVILKEAGMTGVFEGSTARTLDVLVVQTAEDRNAVAQLYRLPREAMREDRSSEGAPKVRLIKIDGMIEPVLEGFIERQIDRAVASGANLLIFEIDSPGGYLLSSTNLANRITDLDPKRVRTVAYVPNTALSGAAIIALGCDEIYMHPHAQLGDAGPIEIGEGGVFERAPEKVVSMLRLTLRALAEKKGRPPALAEAMADRTLQVYQVTHRETGRVWYMSEDEIHASNGAWIQGSLVPETRNDNMLLTVSGQRLADLQLGEPPVADQEDLKQRLGIPPQFKLAGIGRTWVDTLVFMLNHPSATFLLIVVGVICLYLELHLMSGLLGIISALCFSLFFWSRFLGGTAGWLEVILFGLGVACLGLEIFVIPGFGVFGISGGLLVLASLVLASQTFGNLEPNQDFRFMARTMGTLSASLVAVVVLAILMSKYLPHVPIFNQMILAPPGSPAMAANGEPRLRPELEGSSAGSTRALLGKQGEAVSILRPAGKARIGGGYLDVVSEGPYIPQGSRVEVVGVLGNRVVVRQVDDEPTA